jgi:thiol-disulfide isomerase/thioredoxin
MKPLVCLTVVLTMVTPAFCSGDACNLPAGGPQAASPTAQAGTPTQTAPWLPAGWSSGADLEPAIARAAAENRAVLLFFHGSDWCPPCKAMTRDVFSSPEFSAVARDHLVLVDVDFPRGQPQPPPEVIAANLALKARFNVGRDLRQGFPTVVVLNRLGETVWQEKGYDGSGVGPWLQRLQNALSMR